MQETIATALATSRELELDGKKYLLSPLTISDFAELLVWVQDRWAKRLEAALPRCKGKSLYDILCDAQCIGELSAEYIAAVSSREGTCRRFWLMLRHNHPTMTYDEAYALLSLNNMKHIRRMIMVVNGEIPDEGSPRPKDQEQTST